MPWTPLPRIAFAIAIHPFNPSTRDDLPLELGDELYIIEQCAEEQWYRGYLVAPPSLLAGLTSTKGATLEARVFSGIFPASCVDVKEYLSADVQIHPEDAADAGAKDENNLHNSHLHHSGNRSRRRVSEDAYEDEGFSDEDVVAGALARNLKRTRSRRKRESVIRCSTPIKPHSPTGGGIINSHARNPDRQRPAAPVPMLKVGDETSSYEGEPLVDEIASCLREWHAANLHELLLNRQYPLLNEISALVQQLDLSRRQLLNNVLTRAELEKAREDTVWKLVKGNKLLSREIIVRDPYSGRVLTGDDSSVEITTLQSVMSLLDEPPKSKPEDAIRRSHLQIEHRAFIGTSAEPITIVYYLATKTNIPVSEAFTVEVDAKGQPIDSAQAGKLQGLFTDISSKDAEDLYLIARVYTNGSVTVPGLNAGTKLQSPSGSDNSPIGTEGRKGTISSMNGHIKSPIKEEKRLKGRVSVLFNGRPKTAGKENEGPRPMGHMNSRRSRSSSRGGNAAATDNNTPSRSSLSLPAVPPLPSLQTQKISFRRAIGAGVLDIGKFIKQDRGTEQFMHIFVPSHIAAASVSERVQANGFITGERAGGSSNGSGNGGGGGAGGDGSSSGSGGGLMGFGKHSQEPSSSEDWDKFIREIIEVRAKNHSQSEGDGYRKSPIADVRLPSEKSPQADKLHLYLRPFAANNAEELVKSMPTVFHNVTPTRKIGFTGAPTKPRSDIYITLSSMVIPKHPLLVHPKLGSTPLPPTSQFNLIQLLMEVRQPSGDKIPDCIFPSSSPTGSTIWKSAVVSRDETWSQTVRLSLKEEDVPNAHVFFAISGIPYQTTAMAWFPLWEESVFLKDGEHDLVMQKYDEDTAKPTGNLTPGSGYISMPWTPNDSGWSGAMSAGGAAAHIKIKTFLCSTKFSQNGVLLSLLRWKELNVNELMDVLKKVVFVPEMEIVKLLRETFDALFEILVENTTKAEVEDLVFSALVTVLGIVYDRRFNMEPIVDEYAENLFDYPFAAPCLLRSFTRLLHDPSHPDNSVRLRAAFKVGKHIFRFIVKAREKQVLKEASIGINASQTFTKELRGIFKLLESLMRLPDPRLVGSQTLAVQHFHMWLPELMGVLSRDDILLVAIDFMDSCAEVKGKLVLYKLLLIVNYSKSYLFAQPEDRRALTVNTVRWLDPHWGKTDDVTSQWREQVRLCCTVLAEQVDELGEEVSEYIPKIVDSYRAIQATGPRERESFSLLFPKTYPFPTKPISGRPVFDEALAELAAIMAAMSNIPTSLHLVLPEDELAAFLMNALKVHMSILSCEAFPESWLSVHIYQHKSTMRTLETLAGILVDSFLPDPDDADNFNMELWQAFFSTLLMLVGSGALALETFPDQKRRAVWKVAGDVREQGADLLRRTWEAIGWETSADDKRRFAIEKMGGYQVQYVPGLVAPIVELCLSVHEGLRSVAVEVLQTMVVSEWTLSQDLSVIQAEMIDV
jgi:dedicator of cytokinesis protein 3